MSDGLGYDPELILRELMEYVDREARFEKHWMDLQLHTEDKIRRNYSYCTFMRVLSFIEYKINHQGARDRYCSDHNN